MRLSVLLNKDSLDVMIYSDTENPFPYFNKNVF